MRFGYVLLGLVTLLACLHVTNGQVCSNGFPGFQRGTICCDIGCGTCGGRGCGSLPGGRENCCSGVIEDSGDLCSEEADAPCIIDNEMFCSNGLVGVEDDDGLVCCEAQCGRCGGARCGGLPGGPAACCISAIMEAGEMCSDTMEASCIIDDAVVCSGSNGVTGVDREGICCEAQCGTCGGSGCGQRPGGPDACCLSNIMNSDVSCTVTETAPCII